MGGRGGRRTRVMPTCGRADDVDEYGRGTEARTRRRHSCDARRFAWEKPSRPWIREAGTAMKDLLVECFPSYLLNQKSQVVRSLMYGWGYYYEGIPSNNELRSNINKVRR